MERLAYLHNPAKQPFIYQTIPQRIREHGILNPYREAIVHHLFNGERQAITYSELYEQSAKCAQYLVKDGIRKGDRIALIGSNSTEKVIAEIGILLAGAIVVHVTINVRDAHDAYDIMKKANVVSLVIDTGDRDMKTVIDQWSQESFDDGRHLLSIIVLKRNISPYVSLKFILGSDQGDIIELPLVYPEDPAIVFSTSGSTGQPKMFAHSHISMNQHNYITCSKIKTENNRTSVYVDRPFSWFGGSAFHNLIYGQTRVFMDTSVSFTSDTAMKIWNVIKQEKCNFAGLLPSSLSGWLELRDIISPDDFRLDAIYTGGQMVPKKFMKLIGSFANAVVVTYGSSESSIVTVNEVISKDDYDPVGDVGVPFGGYEIRILNEHGNTAKLNEQGLVETRNSYRFKGYMGNASLTKEVLNEDGWYRIGDYGKIDNKGHLVILGRQKDVISRGTRKILPGFIEDEVKRMVSVQNAIVVAVPDMLLLEEICVCFTVSAHHAGTTATDVEEYCKMHFLREQTLDGLGDMPKYFLQYESFPLLPNGKTDNTRLQLSAIERLGIDHND